MARTNYDTPPNPHEAAIIANAESWMAYIFLGRNHKPKVPASTRDEAIAQAQLLANEHRRTAIVYAIRGGSSAFVQNVHPARG